MNKIIKWCYVLMMFMVLVPYKSISQVTKSTDVKFDEKKPDKLKREGPDNIPFEFLNQINSDYEFEANKGIINIFRKIYRDVNPLSGYYYYLPASYGLAWDKLSGDYGMKICYLKGNGNTRGRVEVTAVLKPNISKKDLAIAKRLLKMDIEEGATGKKYNVKKLISMPLSEPPKVSFDRLRTFGVNEDNISIQPPADFLDPILITWRMDNVDDMMTALFNNVGLNGTLTLSPDGEVSALEVPINIKLDDSGVFGQFQLLGTNWRQSGWKNTTDYPVILKNLHVLQIKGKSVSKTAKVYTWKVGINGTEVAQNGVIKFDSNLIPSWIDRHGSIKKVWLEYSIKSCRSCNQKVRKKITCGVDDVEEKEIQLVVLPSASDFAAEMILLEVRSKNADPNHRRKISFPVLNLLDGDKMLFSVGRLFIPSGKKPNYEYRLTLVQSNGDTVGGEAWIKSNKLKLIIGSKQIKSAIPEVNK